jgi:hypothetical protein
MERVAETDLACQFGYADPWHLSILLVSLLQQYANGKEFAISVKVMFCFHECFTHMDLYNNKPLITINEIRSSVVTVPGYRSRGLVSISGATRFSEKYWVWNRVRSPL